jgi:hypothetical protein
MKRYRFSDNGKQLKSFNPSTFAAIAKKNVIKFLTDTISTVNLSSPAHGNRHGLMQKSYFHFDYVHGE